MFGPTRLKIKEKELGVIFGHSFTVHVFTKLWFVVSGVVYSGIEL